VNAGATTVSGGNLVLGAGALQSHAIAPITMPGSEASIAYGNPIAPEGQQRPNQPVFRLPAKPTSANEPTVVVRSGEQSNVEAVREFPYPSGPAAAPSASAAPAEVVVNSSPSADTTTSSTTSNLATLQSPGSRCPTPAPKARKSLRLKVPPTRARWRVGSRWHFQIVANARRDCRPRRQPQAHPQRAA